MTHESQGSDMGLFGGLLGWAADDDRLPDSARFLDEAGVRVRIETVDVGDEHPTTYRLTLRGKNGRQHFLRAISTGGGMIEVLNIDQFAVSMFGDYHVTLIWSDAGESFKDLTGTHLVGCDEIRVHPRSDGNLLEVRGQHFAD